ncbi:carboxymuconolactone decarboxylase family protein [Flavobacterium pallidum]|uniref:Peroxidase n=1 Tax=Flavobacterium pallidum TaxID=2172098 RepID=A0A2S1SFX2_9FLAO|nr:carboxymuconolactone decarboxylase family protein [Flavobacterium pallidum]AWI25237.1 peroxidase [Flavobacterium pallidum]
MTRITALNPDETTGKTKELFNAVNAKLGVIPNMMRTMGNAPALLEGYLSLSGILGKGKLGGKTGELLALAIAESNSCDYCLSAHTFIGTNLVKLDSETITNARHGASSNEKTAAILTFAKTLVNKGGLVNDADVAAVKSAQVSDEEISEIVGHVALNILTNYFNNTANTTIDFPVVHTFAAAEN